MEEEGTCLLIGAGMCGEVLRPADTDAWRDTRRLTATKLCRAADGSSCCTLFSQRHRAGKGQHAKDLVRIRPPGNDVMI